MLSNNLNQISPNECIGNSLSSINHNFSEIGVKVDQLEALLANSVTKIIPGSNITLSPSAGTGVVTISSTINNNSIVTGGVNVGTVGASVFKEKSGQNLAFKKIVGSGTNIVVTEDSNTIKISALGSNNSPGITTQNVGTGAGLAAASQGGPVLPFKSLLGGTGINVSSTSTDVVVESNVSGKNVGNGAGLYKALSGNQLTFKTISKGTENVQIREMSNEIQIAVTESTTAQNIGVGAYLFKEKRDNGLMFRSLSGLTPNIAFQTRDQDIGIEVNELTTGKNLGAGFQVFKEKEGNELLLKTIKKGNNIQITDNGTEIRIDALLEGTGGGEVNEGRNLGNGTGIYREKNGIELFFKTLSAGPGIAFSPGSDVITISAIPPIMGRGDVVGAANFGETPNSSGFYTGTKTVNGFLNFKSLSGGANLAITQTPTNVNVQLSGVITRGQNAIMGTGTGYVFKGNLDGQTLEYRNIKAGAGISVITGTNDVVISSLIPPDVDSLISFYKNKIINGNFDVWQWAQRSILSATSFGDQILNITDRELTDRDNSSHFRFLADRWAFYSGRATTGGSGNQEATFSKRTLQLDELNSIPSRPSYCGRITLNARAQGVGPQVIPTTLFHRIENVFLLAGKQVTLSFYAKSNNIGSSKINLFLSQCHKASHPQYSTYYRDNFINEVRLTSDWNKYVLTFSVPALRIQDIASAWNNSIPQKPWEETNYDRMPFDSFTQLVFEIPGAETRFVDFSSIQLEEGSIATSFEKRPPHIELQLCQRYFEVGTSLTTQYSVREIINKTEIPFKVTKRDVPLMVPPRGRSVLLEDTGFNSSPNIRYHEYSLTETSTTHLRTVYGSKVTGVSKAHAYNWAADAEFINYENRL